LLDEFLARLYLKALACTLYAINAYCVLRLYSVFVRKLNRKTIPDKGYFGTVFVLIAYLLLFAFVSAKAWQEMFYEFLTHVGLTLLFCAVCSILEEIIRQRSVRHILDDWIDNFLEKAETWKDDFEKIGKILNRHPTLTQIFSFFLLLVGCMIFSSLPRNEGLIFLLLFSLLGYCLYLAYALHSCRRLFLLLVVFSFVYALQAAATVMELYKESDTSPSGDLNFWIVLIVYVLLWMFTAIVAEDEPVQMVFKIVNTFTTLIAIAGNILIPICTEAKFMPTQILDGYDNDKIVTVAFNLAILPLVAAGYLAQLTKDIQLYLKKRKRPGLQESQDKLYNTDLK